MYAYVQPSEAILYVYLVPFKLILILWAFILWVFNFVDSCNLLKLLLKTLRS